MVAGWERGVLGLLFKFCEYLTWGIHSSGVKFILCTPQLNCGSSELVSQPLKWEEQIRHITYFSWILCGRNTSISISDYMQYCEYIELIISVTRFHKPPGSTNHQAQPTTRFNQPPGSKKPPVSKKPQGSTNHQVSQTTRFRQPPGLPCFILQSLLCTVQVSSFFSLWLNNFSNPTSCLFSF